MSSFLYYCKNCNTLEASNSDNVSIVCQSCGDFCYPLHVTEDEYNEMSDEEINSLFRKVVIPRKVNTTSSNVQQKNVKKRTSQDVAVTVKYDREGHYSTMSVIAFIFSLIGCLSFIGFILGIVDVSQKDNRKKSLSIAAIVIGVLWIIAGISYGANSASSSGKVSSSQPVKVQNTVNSTSDAETEIESESEDLSTDSVPEESTTNNGDISYEVTDEIFEYYTNSIGNIEYYAIIEITNTGNSNIYMDKATFDFEDDNGHLLSTDDFISKCPDIVAPGEKGYFYNGAFASILPEGTNTDNGLNLAYNVTVAKATGNITEYEVFDTDIKEDYLGPKITGRIKNTSGQDESYCSVKVILYDVNGKVLGIADTAVTDLKSDSTVSFECDCIFISESISFDDIDSYQVIARKSYMQF